MIMSIFASIKLIQSTYILNFSFPLKDEGSLCKQNDTFSASLKLHNAYTSSCMLYDAHFKKNMIHQLHIFIALWMFSLSL